MTTLSQPAEPKELRTVLAEPQLVLARYSPCGRILAGASFDGRVRRWNARSDDYAELPSLGGHHGWCTAVAFGQEGDWLFSADSWGQLLARNAVEHVEKSNESADREEAHGAAAPHWKVEQAHDGWIRDLATSPSGQLLASCGSDQCVRLWSAKDGSATGRIAAYGADIYCLRFSPDEETLLTGDDRGIVKRWKLDGELVREFDAHELHTLSRLQDVGGVRAIAMSPDGKQIAVGGAIPKNGATITGDPTLFVFDAETGQRKGQITLGDAQDVGVADLHWHADGYLIAVTNGTPGKGKLAYVDPNRPEPLYQTTKVINCQSLALRPDGKHLAVVATNSGSNGNGRPLDKEGNYLGNKSPIHIFSTE